MTLCKILHKFGIHWWTAFRFSRWCDYPMPGLWQVPYRTKVRNCRLCNLHNEEKDV